MSFKQHFDRWMGLIIVWKPRPKFVQNFFNLLRITEMQGSIPCYKDVGFNLVLDGSQLSILFVVQHHRKISKWIPEIFFASRNKYCSSQLELGKSDAAGIFSSYLLAILRVTWLWEAKQHSSPAPCFCLSRFSIFFFVSWLTNFAIIAAPILFCFLAG